MTSCFSDEAAFVNLTVNPLSTSKEEPTTDSVTSLCGSSTRLPDKTVAAPHTALASDTPLWVVTVFLNGVPDTSPSYAGVFKILVSVHRCSSANPTDIAPPIKDNSDSIFCSFVCSFVHVRVCGVCGCLYTISTIPGNVPYVPYPVPPPHTSLHAPTMVFSPDMEKRIEQTIIELHSLPDVRDRPQTESDDLTDDFSLSRAKLKTMWDVEATKDDADIYRIRQAVARDLLMPGVLAECEGLWTLMEGREIPGDDKYVFDLFSLKTAAPCPDQLVVHVDASMWSFAQTTLLWAETGKLVRSFHYDVGYGSAERDRKSTAFWNSQAELVAFLREVATTGARQEPDAFAPVCESLPWPHTADHEPKKLPPYAANTIAAFEEVNNCTLPQELKTLLAESRQITPDILVKLCEFREGTGLGPDEVEVFGCALPDEGGEVAAALAQGWTSTMFACEAVSIRLNGGSDSNRRLVRVHPTWEWVPWDDVVTFTEALASDEIEEGYESLEVGPELARRAEGRALIQDALAQAGVNVEPPSWPPALPSEPSQYRMHDKTGLFALGDDEFSYPYQTPMLVLRGPYAGCICVKMHLFCFGNFEYILFPDLKTYLLCYHLVRYL